MSIVGTSIKIVQNKQQLHSLWYLAMASCCLTINSPAIVGWYSSKKNNSDSELAATSSKSTLSVSVAGSIFLQILPQRVRVSLICPSCKMRKSLIKFP